MLGEFKTDQFFVEKTKLANNLYVENLCAGNNFKNNKSKQFFQILTIHYVRRISK